MKFDVTSEGEWKKAVEEVENKYETPMSQVPGLPTDVMVQIRPSRHPHQQRRLGIQEQTDSGCNCVSCPPPYAPNTPTILTFGVL